MMQSQNLPTREGSLDNGVAQCRLAGPVRSGHDYDPSDVDVSMVQASGALGILA